MRAVYMARGSQLLPPAFASLFDDTAAASLDVFFDPSSGSIDFQGLTLGLNIEHWQLWMPTGSPCPQCQWALLSFDFESACSQQSVGRVPYFHLLVGMFSLLSHGMLRQGQGGTTRYLGDLEKTVKFKRRRPCIGQSALIARMLFPNGWLSQFQFVVFR